MSIDLSLVKLDDLIEEIQDRCDASVIALYYEHEKILRRHIYGDGDYAKQAFLCSSGLYKIEREIEAACEDDDIDEELDDDEEK